MKHVAQRIGSELSNYWRIKFSQNKCASMFNAEWVNGKGISFLLYPDKPYEYSNGSIIMQGQRYYEHITDVPSIRLVLNDAATGIDHAIVAFPQNHEVIEENDILKMIIKLYRLSYRDIVVFGRKLKMLNVSIL